MSEGDFPPEIHRLKERYKAGLEPYNDRHERPTEPFTPIKRPTENEVNTTRETDPGLSPQRAIRQIAPDSPHSIPYSKPSLAESLRITFTNFFRRNKK